MKGVILAAGIGTRLRPITLLKAKPAIPFLNRPLIHYSLDMFAGLGIDEIGVNLHYLPETIKTALSNRTERIHYSFEPEILGTAGALLELREFIGDDPFVVSNGKIYFEQDLSPALEFHRRTGALATMIVIPHRPGDAFDPLYVDSDRNIVGFARNGYVPRELAESERPSAGVYTGVQILSPEILRMIPKGFSDIVTDVYSRLIQEGGAFKAFFSDAFWCESSTPRRYLQNSLEVLSRQRAPGSKGAGLAGTSKAVIVGNSVQLPASANLDNCIVWDNVEVGDHCRLRNCVVTSGAEIPRGAQITDAVVLSGSMGIDKDFPQYVRRHETCLIWPFAPDQSRSKKSGSGE